MPRTLDASTLARAMVIFAQALREHCEEINSLNVFPVPDGDTGTNLLLTQEAVVEAIGPEEEAGLDPAGLRERIGRASLMGARGNSGVILSQVLRGLCRRLPDDGGGPHDLVAGLRLSADEAYRAVARPQEGTVLSVLRDAAEAAQAVVEDGADGVEVVEVLEAALAAARESVAGTRDGLPELRQAGVVDAGGKGMVLLLDSMWAALRDGPTTEPVGPLGPLAEGGAQAAGITPREDLAFEVQYLVEADDESIPALRTELVGLGQSLVVVGGSGLYNVHVHTDEAGPAVEAGLGAGRIRNVSIASLRDQSIECMGGQARAVRVGEHACALLAVAEGDGLMATFRSLGAIVVAGGPGNSPSMAEIAAAMEEDVAGAVAVIPNHRSVMAAAEGASEASPKRVAVVPTTSIPAGIAAAAAFNPLAELDENVRTMRDAAGGCRAAELVPAERDSHTPAGPIRKGKWLAVVDGEVAAVDDSPAMAAVSVTKRLADGDAELLTLVVGAGAGEGDRAAVESTLRASFPRLAVEVVQGGQPRSPYLIGVE